MQSPQQHFIPKPNIVPPSPAISQQQLSQSFDKSIFNTINTESYHKGQVIDANPMNIVLNGFFRKALMTNKTVLYEDPNVQIGLVADFSNF